MNVREGGRGEVVRMAWPLAVGMISFTLMGVVDTLLMGRVSTAAQAGVGLATTLAAACLAFFRGLTVGPQSVVAAADGAGDRARVRAAGGAAVLIGAATGLVAAVAVALLPGLLLGRAVTDPEVLEATHAYLGVRIWGMPLAMLAFGFQAALQGLGDTRSRMWVSIAGNLANVGLDLVLIFGLGPVPALGAAGAAWATVASQGLMALCYGLRFRRLFGRVVLPGREVLVSSLRLGVPAGAQGLLNVLAFAAMTVALARAGAAHLAAGEIVLSVSSLSFLPGFGIGEAGGVLVGRFLGAGRPAVARRAVRSARTVALVVMGVGAAGLALGRQPLAGLFTLDPEVAALVAQLLLVMAAAQLFDALAMVHLCALRGAGDTRFTLLVTTVAAWGITVPAAVVLGLWLEWGALGAWLGLLLEMAALAALTSWRVSRLGRGAERLDLLLGRRAPAGELVAAAG